MARAASTPTGAPRRGRGGFRARAAGPVALVALLGALSACSRDDAPSTSTAALDEVDAIVGDAARAAGGSSMGGAAGDARTGSSVSLTLTANSTVRAFYACTGGGSIELNLNGAAEDLDCEEQVREIEEFVVPDTGSVVFEASRPNDVPSAWGVALAST